MGHVWFCVSCIRRLMFPSKISPSLNIPDLHPKVTYCFSEGSTVSDHTVFAISDFNKKFISNRCLTCSFAYLQVLNGMSLSGLESFVKEQERLLCEPNGKEAAKQSWEQQKTLGKTHGTGWYSHKSFLNFILNVILNQPAVTQRHHWGAAERHWLFGHLLNIPWSHFPLYDVFCLHSMSCHVF